MTELAAHRTHKEIESVNVAQEDTKSPSLLSVKEEIPDEEKAFKVPEDVHESEIVKSSIEPPLAKVEETPVKTETVSDSDVSKDEVDGGDDPEDRIHDTPKVPKSRPRRLRADSLVSVSSDVFTPPGSPGPGPGSASLSPTYKMSKKRAQQLRSTPSTPPEDLKVK